MAKQSELTFEQRLAACATAQDRIRLYREAAKHIQPQQAAAPTKTLAESVATGAASFTTFFTNVKTVYQVERVRQTL